MFTEHYVGLLPKKVLKSGLFAILHLGEYHGYEFCIYGSYEDGPKYNSAVDYNQRYGEEITNWEGALATDINHGYETVFN